MYLKDGRWHPTEEERFSPKHTEEMTVQSVGKSQSAPGRRRVGRGQEGPGTPKQAQQGAPVPLLLSWLEPRQRRQQSRSHTGRRCRHLCPEQRSRLTKSLPHPCSVRRPQSRQKNIEYGITGEETSCLPLGKGVTRRLPPLTSYHPMLPSHPVQYAKLLGRRKPRFRRSVWFVQS